MKTSRLLIFTAIFCMANAIFLEDLNPLLDQVQPEGTKIWKRSTLMANLKRLQEILTTLSTSYPDKCLAPSDFRLILRPLLMEASNIINNLEVDPSFVKLIRKRFNGYIRTIIAQHQHSGIVKIDVNSSENQGLQAKININGKTIQTNENGKMQFKVKNCTLLKMRIEKDGFLSQNINGRFFVPHTFKIELKPNNQKSQIDQIEFDTLIEYDTIQSSESNDDIWKNHITVALPSSNEHDCQRACSHHQHCQYYIYTDLPGINCFFGNVNDSNPIAFVKTFLQGIVTVKEKLNYLF